METVAPTAPLVGFRFVIVGEAKTVKLPELIAVTPPIVTEIVPLDAPAGTVVVMLVVVEEVTVAVILLLNLTVLLAGVALNPVPVIVTLAPTAPLVGLKPVMEGSTVKLEELVASCPFTVTVIGDCPAVTPAGTEEVILVVVEDVTVAAMPFIVTELLAGVILNPDPVIVTLVPTTPLIGLKLVMEGSTVKLEELVASCPLTVTVIGDGPAVTPAGTEVVILVVVEDVTVAAMPFIVTALLAGVVLNPVPVIVTLVPTMPLDGAKDVITGAGIKTKPVWVAVPPGVITDTLPEVPLDTTAEI